MTSSAHGSLELDAEAMRALLAELDERLRERGVAASVYVVGGAAMALASDGTASRRTSTPWSVIARSPRKPGPWLTTTA